MLSKLKNQLGFYYSQAIKKEQTKQEILTILNRKKNTLLTQDGITPELSAKFTAQFDEIIALVNRLPD